MGKDKEKKNHGTSSKNNPAKKQRHKDEFHEFDKGLKSECVNRATKVTGKVMFLMKRKSSSQNTRMSSQ